MQRRASKCKNGCSLPPRQLRLFQLVSQNLPTELRMCRCNNMMLAALFLSLLVLTGCQHLVVDTDKIIKSDIDLPEIVGIVAGFGTTFAAFPDLLAMLRRRSSEGMNPRMGAIMGAFQILLGLLRPLDCVATRNHLECDRRSDQLSDRRCVFVLPA